MVRTELEERIVDAAQKYYTNGSSDLSDDEFDALVDQLRMDNPDSDIFKVGWGYSTDADTTYGRKYKHKYGRAGSLDKCRTYLELGEALQQTQLDASLKLDGISIVMYYKQGKLVRALTRGDGDTGIDVTPKIKKIFPMNLADPTFTGAIRGEIVMSYSQFEAFSAAHPEAKSPRNSTAGLINTKQVSPDLQYLNVVVYTIVGEESGRYLTDVSEMRNYLVELVGSENVVPFQSGIQFDADSFLSVMDDFKSMWYGHYPADGIVLTANEFVDGSQYSVNYNAKAFKFRSEVVMATVLDVEWSMSKSSYAVPRVHISPVTVAGATVEYTTGYNAQYILENKIGSGAQVTIERRGEVIPNINEVIVPSTHPGLISRCPECGHELFWNGVHLECRNPECPNLAVQDLLIWLNFNSPMDGLGDALKLKFLQELKDAGKISSVSIEGVMDSDYRPPTNSNSVQFNRFAQMYNNLFSGSVSASSAIQSLNVPRFGEVTANKLLDACNQLKPERDLLHELAYNKLVADDDTVLCLTKLLGDANCRSLMANTDKFHRLRYIYDHIESISEPVEVIRIAVTGRLSVPRSEFEVEISARGFEIGDVSKATQLLITDDPQGQSSKLIKARKLGITILTESQFRQSYLS